MKVAIMQPYLFPYIGYWQLINAADIFIILDDVNYIKKGYINRNEILLNGKRHRFIIPLKKVSQNKLISEMELSFDKKDRVKYMRMIECAYARAPQYEKVLELMKDIIFYDTSCLTEYIQNSIEMLMQYMKLNTRILLSSCIEKDNNLHGEKRIIELCKKNQATCYINPIGGKHLYKNCDFEEVGIELKFLMVKNDKIKYNNANGKFEDNLSIIDVIMNNDEDTLASFLNAYELV